MRDADVVVVGGSLAGIAAALELVKGGRSVMIIEPHTYLGRDITATLRPWLRLDETSTPTSLPEPLRTILTVQDRATTGGGAEIPLHPDTVKRCLEDALLQANVGLLYASLPIGLVQVEGGRTGVVIGNKSGRQVVRCDTNIDATETALIARLAGGTFATSDEGTARFRRTLEFDRLPPLEHAKLTVPEWLGVAYLLFSLGKTPDPRSLSIWKRAAALLDPTAESLRDRFSGTFYYVDALCHAADRSGDPAMTPLLRHLRMHPTLRDQVRRDGFQPDFFEERQAMLELGIARGLARYGSPEGYDVLVAYLDDARALLAERAHSELIDLTGTDHGKGAGAWTAWLSTHVRHPAILA